jgi:DNA-binding XRE family transcriptional regulator
MTDKDVTGRAPIQLLSETADTVTLRRADFDAMLEDLEDAEDRNAILEHDLAVARGDLTPALTVEELDRLLTGESPVKVWRQKIAMTQRQLATHAGVSQSQLAEIETRAKAGSIDTLRKLAAALKVDLDALVPAPQITRASVVFPGTGPVVESEATAPKRRV